MQLVRIRDVEALEGHVVRLTLSNGDIVVRDLSPLLEGPVFEEIRNDPERFREVRAVEGALVCPNGADLCPDTVIWGGLPPAEAATDAA